VLGEILNKYFAIQPKSQNRDDRKDEETEDIYPEEEIRQQAHPGRMECDRNDPGRHHRCEGAGEKVGDK
jgi:hypothetical protein